MWRGRSIRSCVFASFPLGAGGARPRVDGAPRPPGSVRSGRTPGASAKQDPWSGGPRVRVPCSRIVIACTGGTPGCGVRSDRARGSGTQAQPVEGRGRARDRHVRRRDPAPHRDVWIIFSTDVLPEQLTLSDPNRGFSDGQKPQHPSGVWLQRRVLLGTYSWPQTGGFKRSGSLHLIKSLAPIEARVHPRACGGNA